LQPSSFLPLILAMSQLFFHLNTYGPIMGTAKTQPTGRSLASHLHCSHANNNTQQWVCFEGELFFLHKFYHCFEPCLDYFFNSILAVPSWERTKLNPQADAWPPTHIATMPTTIDSGRYNSKMSFCFLHFFNIVF
jgi:hypothetical protein